MFISFLLEYGSNSAMFLTCVNILFFWHFSSLCLWWRHSPCPYHIPFLFILSIAFPKAVLMWAKSISFGLWLISHSLEFSTVTNSVVTLESGSQLASLSTFSGCVLFPSLLLARSMFLYLFCLFGTIFLNHNLFPSFPPSLCHWNNLPVFQAPPYWFFSEPDTCALLQTCLFDWNAQMGPYSPGCNEMTLQSVWTSCNCRFLELGICLSWILGKIFVFLTLNSLAVNGC